MEELQTTEPIEFLELVEPVEAVDFGDLYLRFKDEAEATEVLEGYANIDTIGVIYKPTGEVLQGEDGEYPEMAPIPGWHVNVRLAEGENGEALEPFKVHPETPMRVWA
jgi:hypothetical protein